MLFFCVIKYSKMTLAPSSSALPHTLRAIYTWELPNKPTSSDLSRSVDIQYDSGTIAE